MGLEGSLKGEDADGERPVGRCWFLVHGLALLITRSKGLQGFFLDCFGDLSVFLGSSKAPS